MAPAKIALLLVTPLLTLLPVRCCGMRASRAKKTLRCCGRLRRSMKCLLPPCPAPALSPGQQQQQQQQLHLEGMS